jgi:hypothetical protein
LLPFVGVFCKNFAKGPEGAVGGRLSFSIFDRFTVNFDSLAGFFSLRGLRGATSKRFGNSGKDSLRSDPPNPLNTKLLLLQIVVFVVNLDDWKMENWGVKTNAITVFY